ncbi:MAG: helix-turn-helix transcriptional regulator [Acidobacteria bacterium]|nr:helix-turn-helix transcriptional regulator [Acidobacteriota bacterium]
MPRMATRQPEAQPVLRAFGDRLREMRLAAMLSQAQLAQRSKLQPPYIWRMESGVANPTLVTLALLSRGLGCDVADFFKSE